MAIPEQNIVTPNSFDYETVAASQTDQVLGVGLGAIGDRIERLVCTVATAATSTVTLKDGATSLTIMAATTPIGVYVVDLGITSVSGAWSVTTGAGVTVIAVGRFTK